MMEKKEEKKDNKALHCERRMTKFVEELPEKPELNVERYFVYKTYTYDVYDCINDGFLYRDTGRTSKGNRLLLSITQTLIRIIDAMLIVGSLKKQSKGFYNFDYYMCLTALQCRLKDKFYYIMKNEDMSCDNSILKSVKIVL